MCPPSSTAYLGRYITLLRINKPETPAASPAVFQPGGAGSEQQQQRRIRTTQPVIPSLFLFG